MAQNGQNAQKKIKWRKRGKGSSKILFLLNRITFFINELNFYAHNYFFYQLIIFYAHVFNFCVEFFSGAVCAEFACGDFVHRNVRGFCAQNLCAEMCGGILCRFVRGSFARRVVSGMFVDIVRGVCGGKFFFSGCAREFFSVDDVRGDVFGDGRGNSGPKRGAGGRGGQKGQKGPKMPKMAQNGPKWPKRGGARKWPKMAHFVPEWYTSGSGATAFDSTGWQKSPEYALIRIAAGPLFPPGTKVADLPKWQKSPILAPPESRRFRPGWQKSPISPPSDLGRRVSRVLSSRNFLRGSLPPRKVCTADS